MEVFQLPRFDGRTPEERIQQIENWAFSLVNQLNMYASEQKGGKEDGNI